nr:MAG TPA: hypothetical protein [Caudoviricetes sp.]
MQKFLHSFLSLLLLLQDFLYLCNVFKIERAVKGTKNDRE